MFPENSFDEQLFPPLFCLRSHQTTDLAGLISDDSLHMIISITKVIIIRIDFYRFYLSRSTAFFCQPYHFSNSTPSHVFKYHLIYSLYPHVFVLNIPNLVYKLCIFFFLHFTFSIFNTASRFSITNPNKMSCCSSLSKISFDTIIAVWLPLNIDRFLATN